MLGKKKKGTYERHSFNLGALKGRGISEELMTDLRLEREMEAGRAGCRANSKQSD